MKIRRMFFDENGGQISVLSVWWLLLLFVVVMDCVYVCVEADDGWSADLPGGCFNGSSDLELMAAALRMERWCEP